MPRLLVAAAALVVVALCLAVVFVGILDRPQAAAPPPIALAPPPAQDVETTGGPARAATAKAPRGQPPRPSSATPRAELRELARAAEEAEESVRASLLSLDDAEDATLEFKLDAFLRGLGDGVQGDDREARFHRGALTEVFLRIESVQRDLAALDPSSRQNAIDSIRSEMGYSEEQVVRLQEADAWREARWENGLAYMTERQRLAATFEGEALDEELQALRDDYFGFEAETIAREERQGFFRFERRRIYGRN